MSDKYKIDSNIAKMVNENLGVNYGHAIASAFSSIGEIENQKDEKIKKDEKDKIEKDTNLINLQRIKDEVEDDTNFSKLVLSEKPEEYMKNNPFKTGKYSTQAKDFTTKYKNNLSKEQQEEHYKYATTNFTDKNGNFDLKGATKHLKNRFDKKEIDADTYHNVIDTLYQKTGNGIYAKKMSTKDHLDIMKTQSEIAKLNAQTRKAQYEMTLPPKGYAPTSEEKIYNRMQKDHNFADWYNKQKLDKSRGSGARDIIYANDAVKMALKSDDKNEKSKAINLYSGIIKDSKNVDSFFRALAPTTYQLSEAQKLVKNGGSGVTDEIKNRFSIWTGLDWDKTTQEGRTAFLSTIQPFVKASMKGVASDKDMKMFQDGYATLWQSDKAVANALKNKVNQILFDAKQYENKHSNYIKLTGYDQNIKMLESIVNEDQNIEKPKSKVVYDPSKKKTTQTEQKTQTTNTINSVEDFDKLLGL